MIQPYYNVQTHNNKHIWQINCEKILFPVLHLTLYGQRKKYSRKLKIILLRFFFILNSITNCSMVELFSFSLFIYKNIKSQTLDDMKLKINSYTSTFALESIGILTHYSYKLTYFQQFWIVKPLEKLII